VSDLLNIGKSGLMAYARSIETVSHNIANAENPDYVRRSTLLTDATVTRGLNPLYTAASGLSGVRVNGTVRSSDEFLEAQVRQTGAARVRSETQVTWLERIEVGLDNAGENVGSTATRFFSRGEELAAAPYDTALRLTFLTDLESTASAFRNTASNLQLVVDQTAQNATLQADELNSALDFLAKINLDLTRTQPGTDAQAGLLDSRDAALAAITEKLDVGISLAGNGVATITFDGVPLVTNGVAATVGLSTNPDASFTVLVNGSATRSPANGTLAGLSRASAIAQQRLTDLDTLAGQFVSDVNTWHANGRTDANAPGGALLSLSGGAATMAVTTQNIADLALATSDGTPNGNLLGLAALRGTGGTETSWNNYLAGHANALAAARNESSAAAALDRNARGARDSNARVDLDREAADLIRLQQAYEASARVIQVARETVQSILAIF